MLLNITNSYESFEIIGQKGGPSSRAPQKRNIDENICGGQGEIEVADENRIEMQSICKSCQLQ